MGLILRYSCSPPAFAHSPDSEPTIGCHLSPLTASTKSCRERSIDDNDDDGSVDGGVAVVKEGRRWRREEEEEEEDELCCRRPLR